MNPDPDSTLSAGDRHALLRAAREASAHAYAPYSRYAVGAALLAEDGTLVRGCNVENASYGLSLCAERAAFSTAVAAGHTRFRALAVVARGSAPPHPCGACRQVMAEFCDPDFVVFSASSDPLENVTTSTLGTLLPNRFKL